MEHADKRPDYRLTAMNTITGERVGTLGAAWINPDDSITIKLNRFVVLPHEDAGWQFRLFKNDEKLSRPQMDRTYAGKMSWHDAAPKPDNVMPMPEQPK